MPTIKEIARKRILTDCIKYARRGGEQWLVLVLDKVTTRIISSCCRMYDITTEGVTLVENLDVRRQPLPAMDAVYLITPNEQSVRAMCNDFDVDKKRPQYNRVHVFSTGRMSDELMAVIKASSILPRVQTFVEINLSFLVPESQMVHLDAHSPLDVFNPSLRSRATAESVEGIMSMLLTLEEVPIVRYGTTGANPVAKEIALAVDQKIATLAKEQPDLFKPTAHSPTLLVLDRTHDFLAPLLHEFTYQAMVYDLCEITNDTYKYEAGGKSKEAALNESDQMWPTLRHMHISDCMSHLFESFNTFVKQNKAAKLRKGGVASLSAMSDAIKAMPKYREMMEKYELHIDLSRKCMEEFDKQQLERVAELEQDLVMKTDRDGREIKGTVNRLIALLDSPEISKENKLRLLMVYFVSAVCAEEDRRRLCEAAGLSTVEQAPIMRMLDLGVKLNVEEAKWTKKLLGGIMIRQKKRVDDPGFDLSRFKPALQLTLEQLVQDKLSDTEFPYTQERHKSSKTTSSEIGTSQRSRGVAPTWQNVRSVKKEEDSVMGPRFLVFIAGGITHSEMRVVYELAKQHKRDIIIGGNAVLTPKKYIDGLMSLDSSAM